LCARKGDKHTPSNPPGKYSCAACLAHSTKDTLLVYLTLHASQSRILVVRSQCGTGQHNTEMCALLSKVRENCKVLLPCAAGILQ